MPKALVILAEGFEDVEAVTAVDVLRRAGIEVTVAGLAAGVVTGARGVRVTPDKTLAEASTENHDALVLPGGGKGAENLGASSAVRDLAMKFFKEGKLLAAICAAPGVVLGGTGILEGRAVAGYPGTEKLFPKTARASSETVVVDGNLITGRAMGASLPFSLAVVEKLMGEDVAEEVCRAVLP